MQFSQSIPLFIHSNKIPLKNATTNKNPMENMDFTVKNSADISKGFGVLKRSLGQYSLFSGQKKERIYINIKETNKDRKVEGSNIDKEGAWCNDQLRLSNEFGPHRVLCTFDRLHQALLKKSL